MAGKIHQLDHIENRQKQKHTDGIRLPYIGKFQSSSLYPFRRIQTACIIKQQITWYNQKQCTHIYTKGQSSSAITQKRQVKF